MTLFERHLGNYKIVLHGNPEILYGGCVEFAIDGGKVSSKCTIPYPFVTMKDRQSFAWLATRKG